MNNESIFNHKVRPTIAHSILAITSHPQAILYLLNVKGERRRDKRVENFKNKILDNEKYGYINSRFSKNKISQVTG